MRPKHVYLGLCVMGTILPLAAFLPFLRSYGLDVGEFMGQLSSAGTSLSRRSCSGPSSSTKADALRWPGFGPPSQPIWWSVCHWGCRCSYTCGSSGARRSADGPTDQSSAGCRLTCACSRQAGVGRGSARAPHS
jgi:hypothetical protein